MRADGYQCDGCGVFAQGEPGSQMDPGPFLPKGWWGGPNGYGPCFCGPCRVAIQGGALKREGS